MLVLIGCAIWGGFWWHEQVKEDSQMADYAYLYMEAVLRKDANCDYIYNICTAAGRISYLKLFTIQSVKSFIIKFVNDKDKDKGENKDISREEFRSIMKVVSISKKYNDAVVTVELTTPPENKPQLYKIPFQRDVESKIWKIGPVSAFDFFLTKTPDEQENKQ